MVRIEAFPGVANARLVAHRYDEHWFMYDDCCVVAYEFTPQSTPVGTLLFLHGRFGRGETWWPLVERLIPQYRCICVDFPGFGRSFSSRERGLYLVQLADLAARLLQRLVPSGERAVLVGQDFGGAVGSLCALRVDSMLAGMVLLNCASLTETGEGFDSGWLGWKSRRTLKRLMKSSNVLAYEQRGHLMEMWKDPALRKAAIHAYRALRSSWPGSYERQVWRKSMQELKLPVLLLWGAKDELNPTENGLKMAHDLPEAYFFSQEDCGHWPQLESPDWVALKMREFLFRVIEPITVKAIS